MQVRLGEEVAACPDCGSTEFVHVDPGEDLSLLTQLVCATCERPSNHGTLVLQIGQRALNRARYSMQGRWRGPKSGAPSRRR
jgi:hypothetical protein